jgi:hypothetical protein
MCHVLVQEAIERATARVSLLPAGQLRDVARAFLASFQSDIDGEN